MRPSLRSIAVVVAQADRHAYDLFRSSTGVAVIVLETLHDCDDSTSRRSRTMTDVHRRCRVCEGNLAVPSSSATTYPFAPITP